MKTPKVPEVKLPYASTVASFFGDQGAAQGNSFLGRLFRGGSTRTSRIQTMPGGGAAAPVNPMLPNGGGNRAER